MVALLLGRSLWPRREGYELECLRDEEPVIGYLNRPQSVLEFLQASVVRYPDKTALVDPTRRLSFAALAREVEATARYLAARGLRRGERAALLLPGCIEFAVVFLAILRLGAVAVPLNLKLTHPELKAILERSGAIWLLTDEAHRETVPELLPRTQVREWLVLAPGAPVWTGEEGFPFGSGPDTGVAGLPALPEEDDLAALIFTSGTTGRPKGAMLTHKNLVHSVMSYADTLQLTPEDSTLIAVPVFYVTGLVAQLLLFLYLGGTSFILPRFDPEVVVDLLERHHITFFHAVETVYVKLIEAGMRSGAEPPDLRLACCGGGPVAPATVAALKAWLPGLDFRPVYGLTETSSPATVSPEDASARPDKRRSAGRPVPVVDCRVVDEDGRPVEAGQPGELLVRGPVVVQGYWEDPVANAVAFAGNWFRTGDIATCDRDGFVYIVDRKKDIIIRGGEKVPSSEVEAVLAEFPGVREVAVVGVPDPVYGELPRAFVVTQDGVRVDPDALLRFAGSRLARFKIPAAVVFLPELPRSAYGKVLKNELRKSEG